MFELLSIVCTAAALTQGSCIPGHGGSGSEDEPKRPDAYEMRVGPGMHQLSYAGNGHDFDPAFLTEHWRRRAAQICAGDYRGQPLVQVQYPDPGYDALMAVLPVGGTRTFNVEVFGVAYCADASR